MIKVLGFRKCKECGYLERGVGRRSRWCYWLGMYRSPNAEECEDGFNKRE